jgi:hypothetical protein
VGSEEEAAASLPGSVILRPRIGLRIPDSRSPGYGPVRADSASHSAVASGGSARASLARELIPSVVLRRAPAHRDWPRLDHGPQGESKTTGFEDSTAASCHNAEPMTTVQIAVPASL